MSSPKDVLELLKCDNCNNYLSYFPITIQNKTATICGRCNKSESPVDDENKTTVRNTAYEHLASTFEFPCKFQHLGCTKTFRPADIPRHEANCHYFPIECPFDHLCGSNNTWNELLRHCTDVHKDVIVKDVVEISLKEDFLNNYLFAPDDQLEIFTINVQFFNGVLTTSFWNLGDSFLKNLYFELIVITDKALYNPLIASTMCNKFRPNQSKQLEGCNKAEIRIDSEAQKALIHFKVKEVFPKHKGLVLSSAKKLAVDVSSLKIPEIFHKCEYANRGCIYSSTVNLELSDHEENCGFSGKKTCICVLCHRICESYDSTWSHLNLLHTEHIILNNKPVVWNLSSSSKSMFLKFMDYIFMIKMIKRQTSSGLYWLVTLPCHPESISKKFRFKLSFTDVSGDDAMFFLRPVYHPHDCPWGCSVCNDSLFIQRDILKNYIVDGNLHFAIEILMK